MQGRKRGSAPCLALAGALFTLGLPAAASAGTVQDGISYLSSTNMSNAGEVFGTTVQGCGTDTYAIGGGFYNTFGFDAMRMRALSANGNDAWGADYYKLPATPSGSITINAICDETKPKYVHRTATVPEGKRRSATAMCPSDRHVYGGGGGISNDGWLASSFPIDSNDKDKQPDDGWKVTADKAGDTDADLEVLAICGVERPAYRSSKDDLQPTDQGIKGVTCPGGKSNAIAGGERVSGGYEDTVANTSHPLQAGDHIDAWQARADNRSADTQTLRTFVVCIGDALL